MSQSDQDPALLALSKLKPAGKAARLRQLMPVIETKLNDGVRAADILQALKESGLDLTMGTFRNYVHLYRKKQADSAIKSQESTTKTQAQEESVNLQPSDTAGETQQTPSPTLSKKQLRELEADQFINPINSNPLLKRLIKKEQEK